VSDYKDQLCRVCEWNHRLSRENVMLRIEKRRLEIKVRKLESANADVLTERNAINAALGAAMNAALETKRR
jgi:hypothetical protein